MSEFVNRQFYQLTEEFEHTLGDEMRSKIIENALSQPTKEKALLYYTALQRNLSKITDIYQSLNNLLSIISVEDMKDEWYMVNVARVRMFRIQKKIMDENQSILEKFRPIHIGQPYQMCDECACDDCEIIRDNA